MLARLAGLATVALGAAALVTRRRLVVVTVHGRSMAPTLASGDRVLVARRPPGEVRRGEVVVLERPASEEGWRAGGPAAGAADLATTVWWIKRVAAVAGDPVPDGVPAGGAERVPAGHLVVLADTPGMGDSRRFGLVPVERVLGRVVRRLADRG